MPVDINGTTGVTTPALASAAMPTSGGDPVVESGSNSDGEWTKWADGTQVCWATSGIVTTSATGTSVVGADWTYPLGFISMPSVTPIARTNDSIDAYVSIATYRNTGTASSRLLLRKLQNDGSVTAFAQATGRWK